MFFAGTVMISYYGAVHFFDFFFCLVFTRYVFILNKMRFKRPKPARTRSRKEIKGVW